MCVRRQEGIALSELALLGGTPVRQSPFPSWPVFDGAEVEAAAAAIRSGRWGTGPRDGQVASFEDEFAAFQGARFGTAVHSGTSAIRVCLQAVGLQWGQEVIVPAYTFIGTVVPVMDLGAIPVFVDVDPDTYNIDPRAVEAAITPRTVGIIPVHFAGLPADMDALRAIAERHGLWIMEDAAQGWGSRWKGEGVGHLGRCGIFSFQSSKNITAGEGGIALTDDDETAELTRSFTNCGRETGGVWYHHYRIGGNYRMTEVAAAMLRVQLSRYPALLEKRQAMAARLSKRLAEIPGMRPLKRPAEATSHSYHIYIWRFDESEAGTSRAVFMKALDAEGVTARPGYLMPLYRQPVFAERNFDPSHPAQAVDFATLDCPVAQRACDSESLWLSQQVLIGEEKDVDDIADAIEKVITHAGDLVGIEADE